MLTYLQIRVDAKQQRNKCNQYQEQEPHCQHLYNCEQDGNIAKQWVEDVEYEGNVDAEKALEDLEGAEDKDKDDGKKGKEAAKEGKGKGKKK